MLIPKTGWEVAVTNQDIIYLKAPSDPLVDPLASSTSPVSMALPYVELTLVPGEVPPAAQHAAPATYGVSMMFESTAKEKALAQEPVICCPSCAQKVTGLSGATEAYPVPKNMCVEPIVVFSYQLAACGCRVSSDWAAAFQKELNSRIAGNTPGPVIDMPENVRSYRVTVLEKQLTSLYTLRDKASTKEEKDRSDYLLLATTDRLMRLLPSSSNHVAKLPIMGVSPLAKKWAEDNKLRTKTTTTPSHEAWGESVGVFANACNDVIGEKISKGQRLTPGELHQAANRYSVETMKQILARHDYAADIQSGALGMAGFEFGYGKDYPMPKLKGNGKGKKSVIGVSRFEDFTGRVSLILPDGDSGHLTRSFADRGSMLLWLQHSGYDVAEAELLWPPKKGDKTQQLSRMSFSNMHLNAPLSKSALEYLDQEFSLSEDLKWAASGKKVITPETWWENAQSPASLPPGSKGELAEAYRLANELLKESSYDRSELLNYLVKSDPVFVKIVRACLSQLEQGAVVGTTAGATTAAIKDADALLLTDVKLVEVLKQISYSCQKHRSFCVQLVNREVRTGCSIRSAEEVLHCVEHDIAKFIINRTPLSPEVAKFVQVYILAVQGTTPGPRPAPKVAAPQVPTKLPTAQEVNDKLAALSRQAKCDQKDKFFAQFQRAKRKITVLKKKDK